MPLPHLGINQEVRVCDGCYNKKNGGSSSSSLDSTGASDRGHQDQTKVVSKEEEELQRAIALSLLESERDTTKQSGSQNNLQSRRPAPSKPVEVEEEDPELAAAIAASLREVDLREKKPQKPQQKSLYPDHKKVKCRWSV